MPRSGDASWTRTWPTSGEFDPQQRSAYEAVLEAQQRNLKTFPQRKLLLLNIDAGGVQSRRILDRLIAQEQAQKQEH